MAMPQPTAQPYQRAPTVWERMHKVVERAFKRKGARAGQPEYGFLAFILERALRELNVAEPWELAFLGAAPVVFLLAFYQSDLGMPKPLRGFSLVFLTVYIGLHFVLWVYLDRRLDEQNWLRFKAQKRKRVTDREQRMHLRARAPQANAAARVRNAEALRRGQMKAGHVPAPAKAADDEYEDEEEDARWG